MRTRCLELLRPGEILAEIGRCAVVYLPLAPLEWHGPHLPFGVDPLYAHELALRLADRLGGIVHPCLYLGTERERDATTLKSLGWRWTMVVIRLSFMIVYKCVVCRVANLSLGARADMQREAIGRR